jgi:predicted transcriptional regulator of viral defense system
MMKKPLNQTMNYSTSKNENELLKLLEETNNYIFEPNTINRLTTWNKNKINNTLQQLKKKKLITNIKKNLCVVNDEIINNSFSIAVKISEPSYVSFWSALSYYNLTEQQPITIQTITRKRNLNINLKKIKIEATHFKKEQFFGYKKIENFSIAEIEKALIDSFAYPEKAGGLKEVIKCLKNAKLNQKLFLSYLKQVNNKSLNARIGYIYEVIYNKKLKLPLPTAYVKLNKNNSITKNRNKKWMIIVNEEIL